MKRFKQIVALLGLNQRTGAIRGLVVAITVVSVVMGWWLSAAAAEESTGSAQAPQELIDQATKQLVVGTIRQRDALRKDPALLHALVEEIVTPHLDIKRASALVLGTHWRRASPTQRQRFTNEFRQLLIGTFAATTSRFTDTLSPDTNVAKQLRARITYLPMRRGEDKSKVTVRTRVRLPSVRVRWILGKQIREWDFMGVKYYLHRRDGRWKIYDVALDGLSLVSSFRASFSTVIQREGMDRLIEQLVAKNRHSVSAG